MGAIMLRLAIIVAVILFLSGCCCLDRTVYGEPTARAWSLGIAEGPSAAA